MALSGLRISQNRTQQEMADVFGMSLTTYNQYENNTRTIPKEIAKKMALYFELEIEELFVPEKYRTRKRVI